MRGLFYAAIVMGTRGLLGISCLVRGQVDQGPFRGLSDRVDLPLGSLAIRSPCLVPVVLLLVVLLLGVLLLVVLSPAVQGQ